MVSDLQNQNTSNVDNIMGKPLTQRAVELEML